jgi:hypothetical protein
VGKPKKRTSARKTGLRRSHLVIKLARMVNGKSPVKVRTTKNESGKGLSKVAKKSTTDTTTKTTPATQSAPKVAASKKGTK